MAKDDTIKKDIKDDPFLSTLQSRLLGQSDIISSEDTDLEAKIQTAISGVSTAQKAGAAKLESQAARETVNIRETGARKFTSAQEAQRGFATNTAVLRQITEDTEKSVRDLEQRKQELILQGQADAASQIVGLQMKALEFEQQAKQQVFNNLLGLANFGVQKSQFESTEARLTKQFEATQNFQKEQFENRQHETLVNSAAQAGVTVNSGDSDSDIRNKIAAVAKKHGDAELAKLLKSIEKSKSTFEIGQRADNIMNQVLEGKMTFDDGSEMESTVLNAVNTAVQTLLDMGVDVDDEMRNFLFQKAEVMQRERNLTIAEDKKREEDERDAAVKKVRTTNFFTGSGAAAINQSINKTDPFEGLDFSTLQLPQGGDGTDQGTLTAAGGVFLNNLLNEFK